MNPKSNRKPSAKGGKRSHGCLPSILQFTAVQLLLFLFVAPVRAFDSRCFVAKNFGTDLHSGTMVFRGKDLFPVSQTARTTCRVTCLKGKDTRLRIQYNGDVPTDGVADGTAAQTMGCSDQFLFIQIRSEQAVATLGWEVISSFYDQLSLQCYCDLAYQQTAPDLTGDDGLCFSESTMVQVLDRKDNVEKQVRMKDLQVGDRVLTWTPSVLPRHDTHHNQLQYSYQSVYSFGHYNPESGPVTFYQIYTSNMEHEHDWMDSYHHLMGNNKNSSSISTILEPLEMTGSHLIITVQTADGQNPKAVRADSLKVGDCLILGPQDQQQHGTKTGPITTAVTKITTTRKRGVYMPLTPEGTIVANGIVASTYVSVQNQAPSVVALLKYFPFLNVLSEEHSMIHWWLTPYRVICTSSSVLSSIFCSGPTLDGDKSSSLPDNDEDEKDNKAGIAHWLMVGQQLIGLIDAQTFWVQVVLFGIPIYTVFGFCYMAESMLFRGPSLSIYTIILMTMLCCSWLQTRWRCNGVFGSPYKQNKKNV